VHNAYECMYVCTYVYIYVLYTSHVQVLIRLSHCRGDRGLWLWMFALLVFITGDMFNVFALSFAAQSLLEAIGRYIVCVCVCLHVYVCMHACSCVGGCAWEGLILLMCVRLRVAVRI
jgi:hypothetical protein